MFSKIVDILRCPCCTDSLRGQFKDGLISSLSCTFCGKEFFCSQGVVDFSLSVSDRLTQNGFSFQWKLRSEGVFENDTIYGRNISRRAKDVSDLLELKNARGVILDAGCGAGDIAIELARNNPESVVLAIDYSTSVYQIAARNDLPANLILLRGDIRNLPLKKNSIDLVYSLGVLHHTDNTRKSFEAVSGVVKSGGRMVVWLYPTPDEVPFYKLYYRIRDWHFGGIGHRIPNALRAGFVYFYTVVMYPYLRYGKYRGFFSENPKAVSVREFLGSAALIIFDDITPRYQYRHAEHEVISWYEEMGYFKRFLDKEKLLFCGVKA